MNRKLLLVVLALTSLSSACAQTVPNPLSVTQPVTSSPTSWPIVVQPSAAAPAPARLPNSPGGRLLLLRGNASPYELWIVRPDGTNAERVPVPGLELREDVIPSPDGKSLLLIRSQAQDRITRRSLELHDLAIGQTTVLVSAPITGTGVQEAQWSPDGSAIAFTSDAQNGQDVFDHLAGAPGWHRHSSNDPVLCHNDGSPQQ